MEKKLADKSGTIIVRLLMSPAAIYGLPFIAIAGLGKAFDQTMSTRWVDSSAWTGAGTTKNTPSEGKTVRRLVSPARRDRLPYYPTFHPGPVFIRGPLLSEDGKLFLPARSHDQNSWKWLKRRIILSAVVAVPGQQHRRLGVSRFAVRRSNIVDYVETVPCCRSTNVQSFSTPRYRWN